MFADTVLVLLAGMAVAALVLFIAALRPVLFFAFFFILITVVWRAVSTAYIDLAGPVLSSQTDRWIGPGNVLATHAFAYVLTLLPFIWFFRPAHIATWVQGADRRPSQRGEINLADLTFGLSALFLVWLFVDLVRGGVVPLIDHIERFDFTSGFAGRAHVWLVEYGNLMCLWWGMMFAAGKIRGGRYDLRYPALLAVLFGYALLTGNRFSAFYSYGTFFLMPFGATLAVALAGRTPARPFAWVSAIVDRRSIAMLAVVAVIVPVLIGIGLANNLLNVRGYDEGKAVRDLLERSLVQPSELGWISHERTFVENRWNTDQAYRFLFFHPIDPTRNTTPQYLMLETIGEPRTSQHVLNGFQFAGGFPEIFFELFGPILAWPFLLGASWIAAALLALSVRGVIAGRYASAFLAAYVLYGFLVMYIGGMLNFVLQTTYAMKVAALAIALGAEAFLGKRGLPFIPWAAGHVPGLEDRICRILGLSRREHDPSLPRKERSP